MRRGVNSIQWQQQQQRAVLLLLVVVVCWIATLSHPVATSSSSSSSSDDSPPLPPQETCVVGPDGTSNCAAANQSGELNFGEDMGVKQDLEPGYESQIADLLTQARHYLQTLPASAEQLPCENEHNACAYWAALGECENNSRYMNMTCGPVCKSCDYAWSQGKYKANLDESNYYGEDFGVRQEIDQSYATQIEERLKDARDYLKNVIFADRRFRELRETCRNEHESCAYWAVLGECQNNAGYMNMSCGPVCGSCEYRMVEVRCPMDPNATDALYPGDLHAMFERIVTQPEFKQYEPLVLSRPDLLPGDKEETAPYKLGPWVVVLENMMDDKEAQRLIELGGEQGYSRSGNMGNLNFDGTYDSFIDGGRTSTNAWCEGSCLEDPVTRVVHERISNLTGIGEPNMEFLQMLRYEVGQFYQTHHDYMEHHLRRQPGVRMLTLYLYLNDVEEGGGTNFPKLNLTVLPKRGRAVIWPSVLNEDPNKVDLRTEHQALPVIRGVKYGTNAWIHQRDFKTPFQSGCSG